MSCETFLLRIDCLRWSLLPLILSFSRTRDTRCGQQTSSSRASPSVGLVVIGHDICVLVQQADVWDAREHRGPSVHSPAALTLPSRMLASARPSILTCKTS